MKGNRNTVKFNNIAEEWQYCHGITRDTRKCGHRTIIMFRRTQKLTFVADV